MTDIERKASIALLDKLRNLLVDEYRKVDGEENHAASIPIANDMRMLNAIVEYFKSPTMTAREYLEAKRSMKRVCAQLEVCEGCPMEEWYDHKGAPVCAATLEVDGDETSSIEDDLRLVQRWAKTQNNPQKS